MQGLKMQGLNEGGRTYIPRNADKPSVDGEVAFIADIAEITTHLLRNVDREGRHGAIRSKEPADPRMPTPETDATAAVRLGTGAAVTRPIAKAVGDVPKGLHLSVTASLIEIGSVELVRSAAQPDLVAADMLFADEKSLARTIGDPLQAIDRGPVERRGYRPGVALIAGLEGADIGAD